MDVTKVIRDKLNSVGIKKGDTLLVHSSYNSFDKSICSPESIIQGLLHTIGDDGTLLFPTLTYKTVTGNTPVFDVNNTPSCVGYISEYFRTNFAERRSIHPTHSVAGCGKNIDEILGQHENDSTPCGINSPFQIIRNYNAKILFMGCGINVNTSFHAIEEEFNPEYLFNGFTEFTIINGKKKYTKEYQCHGFNGYIQRYDRIAQSLTNDEINEIKICNSNIHIIDSSAMYKKAKKILQINPFYFVEKIK